jgi:hypothetical protein
VTRLRRRVTAVVGLGAALAPGTALACASCASSAYGDRSFNWAYGALMLTPFLVASVIAGILAWSAGYRLRWRRLGAPFGKSSMGGPIPVNEERS